MVEPIKIPYWKKPINARRRAFLLLGMLILTSILCVNLISATEGDYISSFSIAAQAGDGTDLATDGTNLWVLVFNRTIYKYDMDGNYLDIALDISSFTTQTYGLTTDGTNFWIADPGKDLIIKLDMAGNNLSSWSVPQAPDPVHVTTDGTNIWVVSSNSTVYKYDMDGVYANENWLSTINKGITTDGTNIWQVNDDDDEVYRFNITGGNDTDTHWDISNQSDDGWGITTDDISIWVIDFGDEGVDKYVGAGSIAEIQINLTSPANNAVLSVIGTNFTVTYTATDYNFTNATYHVWNSTGIFNNSIIVNITGTSNSTIEYIDDFVLGNYKWNVLTCWENAIFSNCSFADANYSFVYAPFSIIGETYNNQTIEGSSETFFINITIEGGYKLSTVNLVYNNTNYLGTLNDFGGGNYEVSRNLTIPSIGSNVNMTFYWTFSFEDELFTNTTFHNQTVFNMSIDDCSTYTNIIYNFTIVDEESQDSISANNSIEILANVYSVDRSILVLNYSGNFNVSSIDLCTNRNLSNFASTHLFDSTVKYSAQDHETEYYNIEGYSLTNQSGVQYVILYDLLTSDSTEFQLTFTGSDFLAVENALVFVKRQYVGENVFKTVELPKTDSNGQTILHLVKNDVVYNIEIMKGGVVLGSFENIIAFCDDVVIGDCKIILNAAEAGEAVFNYNDALGITYTGPIYDDETRIITFNFLTTDGSVKTVLMNATRNDIFGNISICSASIVSSGGTLTCEVPSHVDDSTIITKVFVDGIEILKDYTVLSEFNYGKAGYFIFFVYMLAFIFMFSKSKTTMLIGIVVGFIVGITLGLISGRLMGVGASGIWLIIVIILMVWKLNKERPN